MTSSAVLPFRHTDSDEVHEAAPPATPLSGPVFSSDAAGSDLFGRDRVASRLADLLVHHRTETPLTLAIYGPPGSGKSMLLRSAADGVRQIGGEPPAVGRSNAASARVPVAWIDLRPGADPAVAVARGLIDALAPDHAAFVEDALHAGGDPHDAAKRASDRSIALRRGLDGERKILDDFGARRARLVETVLFDTAGTRVDGYARANRARIENRLRAFGLPTSDPLRTYKDFVRATAEKPGIGSRVGFALRSLWAFKGQGSLIVLAIMLFALGWAAGIGVGDEARLSGWLASLGDRFAFLTDWERAHLDWLQPISQSAWALGGLALAALVLRAFRFAAPILKGAALVRTDLAERRRDIDGLIAQQTRRIDGLEAEAEAAAFIAEQADRRLGGRARGGLSEHGAALAGDLFGSTRMASAAAQAFCASLSQAMAADVSSPAGDRPTRVVVAIDGFDHLPPADAAAALDTVHLLLARPGFATLVALDRRRILDALGDTDPATAAARLERVIQLSYDIGADLPDSGRFADLLLDPRTADPRPATGPLRPSIDRPLLPSEVDVIKGLAPFAGTTPRAVKRFVNTYRFARTDGRIDGASSAVLGCLAWALALDGTPAGAGLAAFETSADRGKIEIDKASDLGRAFSAVYDVIGGEFTAGDVRLALRVARSYSA